MKRLSAFVLACLCMLASLTGPLEATASAAVAAKPQAPANYGQALEIAPPLLTLTANPGQVIKTQIDLRDISPGPLIVKSQINDFVANGEDGTPKLLLDQNNNEPDPFSIKGWVAAPADLSLTPKQIKTLPISIHVPADASPGGHYGVVRFSATPPNLQGTGVSLSASLGSLVLIIVNGDIKENLSVAEFSTNKDGKKSGMFQSTPFNFVERIKNTGNLHEQPAGNVIVSDMFGKPVGGVNVNLPPRNILPSSIRKFSQPFDSTIIGNKKLFGRYTAKMTLTYGVKKEKLVQSITFWVIPWKLIAIAIVVLIILFFVLRAMLRSYTNRAISRSRGGRRR